MPAKRTKETKADTPRKRRKSPDEEAETRINQGYEKYFEEAAQKKRAANLNKLPTLDPKEYLKLNDHVLPYQESIDALLEAHTQCFEQWSYELRAGFTICLYGFGSKRSLLMDFAAHEADDVPYVVINGYHPSIDIRQICRTIMAGLEPTSTSSDVTSLLTKLDTSELVLIIHNIDGPCLRNDKAQTAISQIISHHNVRAICSIDHVNAPRLWTPARLHAMSMIFHDATTFLPLMKETELHSAVLNKSSVTLTGDRGIQWILQSLSQNAQRVFKLLLDTQLETGSGIEATRLFELASRAFIVSNQSAFHAQLTEFLDHQIITSRHSSSGQILSVPFTKDELIKIRDSLT